MALDVYDIVSSSFCNWYSKFKKCSIESEILELPSDVLAYLLDTGTLVLPLSSHTVSHTDSQSLSPSCNSVGSTISSTEPSVSGKQQPSSKVTARVDYDSDESDDEDWSTDASPAAEAPVLEEFSNKIRDAISRLGGTVFPKLNWTAPKDAYWMSYTNSLKCYTPADVYLLLKSSTLLIRDLTQPFQDCRTEDTTSISSSGVSPALVLRRWQDINTSTEFRGFVKQGCFVGLSPRDITQHYACLGAERSSIVSDITSFWRENIENRFPLRSYVFDVVRSGKDSVLLLDFSPLHPTRTSSLLFEWHELGVENGSGTVSGDSEETPTSGQPECIDLQVVSDELQHMELMDADSNRMMQEFDASSQVPEFRYINEETGVQPNRNRIPGLPVDFMDLCSGQDPYKLIDLLQLKVQRNREEWSSSDEEA